MFLLHDDKELFYQMSLITFDVFILKYKKMCIDAAQYARLNKDFEPVYKTCVIYARQHFERMKKIKDKKIDFAKGFIK